MCYGPMFHLGIKGNDDHYFRSSYTLIKMSHRYKQVNTQRHLLLWEPLRILSNSAPKIWSSVIWLNGVESSKGFQSAISADRDLPPAVTALDSSPCIREIRAICIKNINFTKRMLHMREQQNVFYTWILTHPNMSNMCITSFHTCIVNSMTLWSLSSNRSFSWSRKLPEVKESKNSSPSSEKSTNEWY